MVNLVYILNWKLRTRGEGIHRDLTRESESHSLSSASFLSSPGLLSLRFGSRSLRLLAGSGQTFPEQLYHESAEGSLTRGPAGLRGEEAEEEASKPSSGEVV